MSISNIVQGLLGQATNFRLTAVSYNTKTSAWLLSNEDFFESDATVSEGYNFQAEVSTYPVEAGYPATDMGGTTGFSVSFNGVNSNSFIEPFEAVTSGEEAVAGSFGGAFSGLLGMKSRVQAAYDRLETWANTGQPLSLRTIYAKEGYTETPGGTTPAIFVITAFDISRDDQTGDSIGYSLTVSRVFISSPDTDNALPGVGKQLGTKGLSPAPTGSGSTVDSSPDQTGANLDISNAKVQGSSDAQTVARAADAQATAILEGASL